MPNNPPFQQAVINPVLPSCSSNMANTIRSGQSVTQESIQPSAGQQASGLYQSLQGNSELHSQIKQVQHMIAHIKKNDPVHLHNEKVNLLVLIFLTLPLKFNNISIK